MKRFVIAIGLSFLCITGICQSSERFYIHTDRQSYIAGETIWFKAYLLQQFAPGDEISNLYVELLDIKENVLIRKKFPVFWGTAIGDIDIIPSTPQGIYLLKAYAKLSIGEQEGYSLKPVYLFNPSSEQTLNDLSQSFYDCRFFTESDHLTANLTNTIYFKATGTYNTPVNISGNIVNESNQTILAIKDAGNGTGKFELTPNPDNTYLAKINFPNGITKTYSLPLVRQDGLTLSMKKSENNVSVYIVQNANTYIQRKLVLLGIMGNQTAFKHEFLLTKQEYSANIPTKDLPEGLLHMMILAGDSIITQKKTFIKRSDNSAIKIKLNQTNSDSSNFSITFPDSILGTFSISITNYDKEVVPNYNNIVSELLINQEGHEKNTLLGSGDLDKRDLTELAINTISSDLKRGNPEKQNGQTFIDTSYLGFKGKIIDKKTKKPASKGELILFFNDKDSNSAIFTPAISNDGSFSVKDLIFYDTATVHYEWKGKSSVELTIDDTNQEPSKNNAYLPFVADLSVFNSSGNIDKIHRNNKQVTDSFQFKTLSPITVKSKSPGSLKEQVNAKYASGLFLNNTMGRILDLIHEPPPNIGINIFDYLQGKLGDLTVTRLRGGQYSLSSTRLVSITGSASVRVYLNQTEVSTDFILNVPLKEVAMIKYFPPGTARLPGVGATAVLAVYTKKIEDVPATQSNSFTTSFKLQGYSPAKDFTEETQFRLSKNLTTIYWNPNVFINGSNNNYTVKIKDINSVKRFHIIVEGFTSEGDILFADTIIENK